MENQIPLNEPLFEDEFDQPLLSETENLSLRSVEDRGNDLDNTHVSFWPSTWAQHFFFFKPNYSTEHYTCTTKKSRILDRQGRFYQSRGRWRITSAGDINRIVPPRVRRFRDDWFHSLAYTPTPQLFIFLFLWYTLTIGFWAAIYYAVSKFGSDRSSHSQVTSHSNDTSGSSNYCGLDITNGMEALYFSLSTMSGIGYGVSDYYFGDCILPFILVLGQILNGIAFDAVAIGLLFQRMSRGQKRGRTIVFSHHAVIQRVKGQYYFMFRVGELRSRHIVDARARVYCIRHERFLSHGTIVNDESSRNTIDSYHFITHPVPLLCDESSLLMSLPHVFTHKMDRKSPLLPSAFWYDKDGSKHTFKKVFGNDAGLISMDTYIRERENIIDFLQDREAEIVVLLEVSNLSAFFLVLIF